MANSHSLDLELSSSQYAHAANSNSLDISGDITVECWMNLEQLPATVGAHLYLGAQADPTPCWYWQVRNTTNKMAFIYWGNTPPTLYTYFLCDTAFDGDDVGVWIHVAAAVDVSAKTANLYINGSLQNDTVVNATATSIYAGNSNFTLGATGGGGTPFDGKIDDFRIWNDIRSTSEIDDNKCIELVGNEAGLAAYWKLNNSYLDETANDNDLTAVNSPVFSTEHPACFPEPTGPAGVKTINELAIASVKTIQQTAIASVKTIQGSAA